MKDRVSTAAFLGICAIVGLLVLVVTVVFNYRVNRWGVFAEDFQSFYPLVRPNRHWLKTRFMLENGSDYDCILFGSSRVGAIDSRRLPGQCYNFTHSGGLPANHLLALKTIVESGVELKRVYMGLDDISYFWDPADNIRHYLRRGYPRDWTDWVSGHVFYLLEPIELNGLSQALGNVEPLTLPEHVLDPMQDWRRFDRESREYLAHPEEREETFQSILEPLSTSTSGSPYRGREAARAVRDFVEYCRQRDIEVVLFFNPLHSRTYLSRDYPYFIDFKRRLAEVQGFYDFTGLNPWTTDNRYWKEASHYSPLVGNAMLDVMLGGEAGPAGFGRLVTSGNLDRLERRQLQTDFRFLPGLMKKEGVMRVPPRLAELFASRGALRELDLRLAPHEHADALGQGGPLRIVRGDDAGSNVPAVRPRMPRGTYFLLEFSMEAAYRGRITFQLRWREEGGRDTWRTFRYIVQPGSNAGYVGGYASRRNPPLRLEFNNGDIDQLWQPLKLYAIDTTQQDKGTTHPTP